MSAPTDCLFCGPDHPEGLRHSSAEFRAYEAGLSAGSDAGPVLHGVVAERIRQDRKWGPQNHPDGTGRPGSKHIADYYRAVCQANTPETDNWQDILSEEVFEAFVESDPVALRKELIQVAAVAVAWAEAIDRRMDGLRCRWVMAGNGTAYCHLSEGHTGDHDFYRCVGDLPTCPVCPGGRADD